MCRAIALPEATAASTFSPLIRIHCPALGVRLVRRAITWPDAAIISIQRTPRDVQARAAVTAGGALMEGFRFMAVFDGPTIAKLHAAGA